MKEEEEETTTLLWTLLELNPGPTALHEELRQASTLAAGYPGVP